MSDREYLNSGTLFHNAVKKNPKAPDYQAWQARHRQRESKAAVGWLEKDFSQGNHVPFLECQ